MLLLVTSRSDPASRTILRELLRLGDWEPEGTFEGHPAYQGAGRLLITIEDNHLDRDHLDRDVHAALGATPDAVAYASRHRSESGLRSLTIHPIGNFGEARFGGEPQRLVPAAPHWMTEALRRTHAEARSLDYTVSFEATHHGPTLETPAFYIELGSEETAWKDRHAAAALARVLVDLTPATYPVALGIGGGHYVPRLTDVALTRKVSFGHLVSTYALEAVDAAQLRQAMERTPGATLAYLHRKALKGPLRQRAVEIVEDLGLRLVRQRDLAPLPGPASRQAL